MPRCRMESLDPSGGNNKGLRRPSQKWHTILSNCQILKKGTQNFKARSGTQYSQDVQAQEEIQPIKD